MPERQWVCRHGTTLKKTEAENIYLSLVMYYKTDAHSTVACFCVAQL